LGSAGGFGSSGAQDLRKYAPNIGFVINQQNEKKKSRKQADIKMLQIAAACGEMRIKYVDES
jgi:hypothetical protein